MQVELSREEIRGTVKALNFYTLEKLYELIAKQVSVNPHADLAALDAQVNLIGDLTDRLEEMLDE